MRGTMDEPLWQARALSLRGQMNPPFNCPPSRSGGPLIKMADYERIHAVTRAVLDSIDAHTSVACAFFSLAGAFLLQKHHKVDAMLMAGAAFYCLGGEPKPNVFAFARQGDVDMVSDLQAFHCWIDCDGWVIDFMAPIFPESAQRQGFTVPVPRRMFQRSLSTMAASWSDLSRDGDFFLEPNAELTATVMTTQMSKPSVKDLVNVCDYWYRPTPRKMEPKISMASDDGSIRIIALKRTPISGAW